VLISEVNPYLAGPVLHCSQDVSTRPNPLPVAAGSVHEPLAPSGMACIALLDVQQLHIGRGGTIHHDL